MRKIKKIILILFLIILSSNFEKNQKPSFLLLTLDTWRWDYIGISGSGKVKTPNLDEIARKGFYVPETLTPCPLTTPAHATILTGLNPLSHGVLDCTGYKLKENIKTIAEIFRENGYETAAFISSETLNKRFGLDKGFDLYDDSDIKRRGENDWLSGTRDGAITTDHVLKYIKNNSSPLFLWVHYFDMHVPYKKREKYYPIYPKNPYAAQVAFVDEQVGIILKKINEDKKRKWRIIIVGDHGEGLGEKGEYGHGYTLYNSTLHIPLIIYPKLKGVSNISMPISLEDIAPTVIDWFNFKTDIKTDGVSLFKFQNKERDIYSFTFLPSFIFNVNPVYGARRGDFMLIKHGIRELYDMKRDKLQEKNLAYDQNYNKILNNLSKNVMEYFSNDKLNKILVKNIKQNSESEKKLQSLGYMSGPNIKLNLLQRANISELLKDINSLDAAKEKGFLNNDFNELVMQFKKIIEKYPNAQVIYKNYGKLLINIKNFDEAEKILEKAVELDSEDLDSIVNLGTIYFVKKNYNKAKILLETALLLDPEDPQANKNLAILCADFLNDVKCAVKHFTKYLEIVPESPEKDKILNYIKKAKENPVNNNSR